MEIITESFLSLFWFIKRNENKQQANDRRVHESLGFPTKNIRSFTERQHHEKSTQDHDGG